MRIQITSDADLEFLEQRVPGYHVVEPTWDDVLVITSHIHRNARTIAAFADRALPVVYVYGN